MNGFQNFGEQERSDTRSSSLTLRGAGHAVEAHLIRGDFWGQRHLGYELELRREAVGGVSGRHCSHVLIDSLNLELLLRCMAGLSCTRILASCSSLSKSDRGLSLRKTLYS